MHVSRNVLKLQLGLTGTDSSVIASSPTGATQSGTTVTITTTSAHNLSAGQIVTIAGVTATGYNGVFVVLTVPSTTTFTYSTTSGLSASGSGTVTGPTDSLLDMMIAQCSARIDQHVGYPLAAATYTKIYRGNDTPHLFLSESPVNSITSIYEDVDAAAGDAADPFAAATELTEGEEFYLDRQVDGGPSMTGIVVRIGCPWPKPRYYRRGIINPLDYGSDGNIKITYNAGYSTIPDDVQMVCLQLCKLVDEMRAHGMPLSSESWSGYSYSLAQDAAKAFAGLPANIVGALSRYRRIAVG